MSGDMRRIGRSTAEPECEDYVVNTEQPFGTVVSLHDDVPLPRLRIARSAGSDRGQPYVEFHGFGIKFEPVSELRSQGKLLLDNGEKNRIHGPSGQVSIPASWEGNCTCADITSNSRTRTLNVLHVRHVVKP